MRAQTEAMRALAYVVAAAQDIAKRSTDAAAKAKSQAFADLMIPVVKGWSTETGIDVCSTGVQVHGGMGFIEETGAAQYYRDVRITSIYEGTTAIQANDLIGRKMAREGGSTIKAVIAEVRDFVAALSRQDGNDFAAMRQRLSSGIDAVEKAASWLVETYGKDIKRAHVGSVPFLKLLGIVAGGWQLARAALIAQGKIDAGDSDAFYRAKVLTARFYADHLLTQAAGLAETIVGGAGAALEMSEDQF
jgi:alkylation response protein AidB-like acyl-CoA dehydrogenase